ncbi:MAG: methenyltetrahydromethanopterin cyclohydrolase [Planctomycetaceae bacterium]
MTFGLNERARHLTEYAIQRADELKISVTQIENGGRCLDFGANSSGGIAAGLLLARITLADLAEVQIVDGHRGGQSWPMIQVTTDHPVPACLFSQYAGWQIALDNYFAMGSGPMRAAAAREELFEKLSYQESANKIVGTLETSQSPDEAVFALIAEKTGVSAENIDLVFAPVTSLAGSLQVVARSVETALHKLLELGFDMSQLQSGLGSVPLPTVAKDDLIGIGRTNDAILYGGDVHLWVTAENGEIEAIGPRVPSESSSAFGKPFLKIFEDADRDFYNIDPHLFSPAKVTFHNLKSGDVFQFGQLRPEILSESFGC